MHGFPKQHCSDFLRKLIGENMCSLWRNVARSCSCWIQEISDLEDRKDLACFVARKQTWQTNYEELPPCLCMGVYIVASPVRKLRSPNYQKLNPKILPYIQAVVESLWNLFHMGIFKCDFQGHKVDPVNRIFLGAALAEERTLTFIFPVRGLK